MQDYNTIIGAIQMRLNKCPTRSVMDRLDIFFYMLHNYIFRILSSVHYYPQYGYRTPSTFHVLDNSKVCLPNLFREFQQKHYI